MKEIAENYFETVYKEWKIYNQYVQDSAEKIENQRKDFTKTVEKYKDDEQKLSEELFKLREQPIQMNQDLQNLCIRLTNTYDSYHEIIEIPAEIKTEISKLPRYKYKYFIEKGEAKEVNPAENKRIKEQNMAAYREILETLKGEKRGDE